MKPHRPFSTTVGVLIVVLAVLGSAHAFFSSGGLDYYGDHPVRILLVLCCSAFLGIMVWFASRQFPRFLPLLQVSGLVVVALALTVCSVLIACITAQFWSDEVLLGAFRWVGVGFAAALGGLAVESWRECAAAWNAFRQETRTGEPDTAANAAPPGRFV